MSCHKLSNQRSANGFWIFSYARDAVSLVAPTGSPVNEDRTMIGEVLRKLYDSAPEEIPKKTEVVSQISEKDMQRFMAHLVNRVEKLEATETSRVEQLTNVSQSVDELRNDDNSVWERYNDKFHKIEKNIDTRNTETIDEINAIKSEFHTLRKMYSQLKSCCDTNARFSITEVDVEKHVEREVAGYFGSVVSKKEFNKIVDHLIVGSKDEQSNKIVNRGATSEGDGQNFCTRGSGLSDEDMRRIVNEVLKIYDADKTGRVDYALESAGGQVISTRCTQRYNVNTRAFKLLGFTLYYESNNPRTVIQGNSMQPGACWAFQDFPGYLLIKLRSFIRVTGFTVEHVPRSILPNSEMRSAPRKFDVWGLTDESDPEPVIFGNYEFQDSDESLQYFPVHNTDITTPYEYVELRIHSNHGQLEYTCLYRFRVHGIPV